MALESIRWQLSECLACSCRSAVSESRPGQEIGSKPLVPGSRSRLLGIDRLFAFCGDTDTQYAYRFYFLGCCNLSYQFAACCSSGLSTVDRLQVSAKNTHDSTVERQRGTSSREKKNTQIHCQLRERVAPVSGFPLSKFPSFDFWDLPSP